MFQNGGKDMPELRTAAEMSQNLARQNYGKAMSEIGQKHVRNMPNLCHNYAILNASGWGSMEVILP